MKILRNNVLVDNDKLFSILSEAKEPVYTWIVESDGELISNGDSPFSLCGSYFEAKGSAMIAKISCQGKVTISLVQLGNDAIPIRVIKSETVDDALQFDELEDVEASIHRDEELTEMSKRLVKEGKTAIDILDEDMSGISKAEKIILIANPDLIDKATALEAVLRFAEHIIYRIEDDEDRETCAECVKLARIYASGKAGIDELKRAFKMVPCPGNPAGDDYFSAIHNTVAAIHHITLAGSTPNLTTLYSKPCTYFSDEDKADTNCDNPALMHHNCETEFGSEPWTDSIVYVSSRSCSAIEFSEGAEAAQKEAEWQIQTLHELLARENVVI